MALLRKVDDICQLYFVPSQIEFLIVADSLYNYLEMSIFCCCSYFNRLCRKKNKKSLLDWTRDVVNDFWYSADVSNPAQEFMVILCPSGLLCLELEHGSCLKETSVKKGQCQLRVKVFESCESSFLLVILLSE